MDKVLAVIGATGRKSSSAFIERLCDNSSAVPGAFNRIKCLVRETSDTSNLKNRAVDFEILRGNILDSSYLEKALAGVDTVINIANIKLSPIIIDAAAKCGVRRVILVHTTGIYSKYKAAGEEYRKIDAYVKRKCRENNIIFTILRPTMIYGNIFDKNMIKFIKMVDALPLMPVINGGNYLLQPVHYDDLATAYYQVLSEEENTANKCFNLSGGEEILLRDVFEEIGKNLGKKMRFISVPFWIAYLGALCVRFLTLGKIDYREKVQRLCEDRVYSHEDAREAFCYTARMFKDGIKDEIVQYKSQQKTV